MIALFLRQHRFLLSFIIGWHIVLNGLILLDSGLATISLIYMNVVWLVLVLITLIALYMYERHDILREHAQQKDYIAAVSAHYEQQLDEAQLQQKKTALHVQEQQDEILAWVHDMKSPMTALKLIHERIELRTQRERAEKEWLRLYLLLDQQLHATRIQSIAEDNRLEEVALQPIIIEEIKALRTWCFEKQLEIDFEGTEHCVISDKKWVSFIIRQLLTNAVKYSHHGGTITINVQKKEYVTISIHDEGIGIAAEDLPRIFKKSYTGTIGRETKAATGMGLYLAKQSADALHIQLAISSFKSEGTTATMTFQHDNEYVKTLRM